MPKIVFLYLLSHERSYSTSSPVSTGMGDRLRVSIPPRYVTQPTRSTQPCIPPESLNRVPALTGWGKGGNVTSAGWQAGMLGLGLGLGLALRPESGGLGLGLGSSGLGLGLGSSGLGLGLDTKALALPISRPRPGCHNITNSQCAC